MPPLPHARTHLCRARALMPLQWWILVFSSCLLEPSRASSFPFPVPLFGPSYTNQQDVDAVNELYAALGSPELRGWAASGGDPCGEEEEAWQGVHCLGPNITAIELRGAGLEGELSEALGKLTAITRLDLSWNNLTGELPGSMQKLRSLSTLHVQNNQLTGTLDVLRDLALKDLNVENNLFSGSIPEKLLGIPKFLSNGNRFPGSSPAPAASSPPPAARPRITVIPAAVTTAHDDPPRRHGKKVSPAKAAGFGVLAAGSLSIAVLVAALAVSNRRRRRERSVDGGGYHLKGLEMEAHPSLKNTTSMPTTVVVSDSNNVQWRPDGCRSLRYPLKFFTVASLQQCTNSFSDEKNLVRETRFGKIYLAEHLEGKFAVLKLRGDKGGATLPASEFLEKVRSISGIEHANIEELVGCCVEHGQRLLVYKHFSERTLDDVIHTDDGDGDPGLPWDARVAVALDAAKALEHLHDGGGAGRQGPGKVVAVHGHFGAEHVLVDGEARVRVSGCGLAPFAAPSGTPDRRGNGEQPPEEAAMGDDVYGLGVVMLQLLTGRRPYDGGGRRLVPWARARLHDLSALRRMADPRLLLLLRGTAAPAPVRSLSRFADIISRCVQPEAKFRPAMAEVVQDLRRAMEEARAMAAVELRAPVVEELA